MNNTIFNIKTRKPLFFSFSLTLSGMTIAYSGHYRKNKMPECHCELHLMLTISPWVLCCQSGPQRGVWSHPQWTGCWLTCRQIYKAGDLETINVWPGYSAGPIHGDIMRVKSVSMHVCVPYQRWLKPVFAATNSAKCGAASSVKSFCTNLQQHRHVLLYREQYC